MELLYHRARIKKTYINQMRLFNFQMSEELRRKTFTAAERSGKTASRYVREAVSEKLEREDGQGPAVSDDAKELSSGGYFERTDAPDNDC